ncbi:hypothetical protein PG993_000922 [Apiospora rasikravindrae]|uniref:Nudix hydrolase domain-containing protein n=1 Tax=Apiospora rasikravindrae TaxID=990691 RepID=A0ABR1U9Y9_9PEZI
MSSASTPTKPKPKGTTNTHNEDPDGNDDDNNDNTIEIRSYAYRAQILHIRSSFEQSVSAFKMPIPTFELLNPLTRKPLEISAIVFNAQRDKVLLLQRIHAPNAWEVPSFSIFEGRSRRSTPSSAPYTSALVRNITRCAGFYEYESVPPWPPSRRYCFVVEVDHPEEEEVALWLRLYQSFAWVTAEDVDDEKYGRDREALDFHAPALRWILQKAFRVVREEKQKQQRQEQQQEQQREQQMQEQERCQEHQQEEEQQEEEEEMELDEMEGEM